MVDAVDVAQPRTPQRPSTPASRRHTISERQPHRAARPPDGRDEPHVDQMTASGMGAPVRRSDLQKEQPRHNLKWMVGYCVATRPARWSNVVLAQATVRCGV